jgi:outer membrane protein OmpA-like peptidoglycan-associated protein
MIRISGYADFLGQPAYNVRLSRRRALTVKRVIQKGADISDSLVKVRAFGERLAVARTRGDRGRRDDRRVVLVVFYKP